MSETRCCTGRPSSDACESRAATPTTQIRPRTRASWPTAGLAPARPGLSQQASLGAEDHIGHPAVSRPRLEPRPQVAACVKQSDGAGRTGARQPCHWSSRVRWRCRRTTERGGNPVPLRSGTHRSGIGIRIAAGRSRAAVATGRTGSPSGAFARGGLCFGLGARHFGLAHRQSALKTLRFADLL
jgi:hypothetical protein